MTVKKQSSAFVLNSFPVDTTKSVIINYDSANVSNITRDSNSIVATYDSVSASLPNLVFIDGSNKYSCKADKIYFTNNFHTISGVTMDGELVVHHTIISSTNGQYSDFYTVFPLHNSGCIKPTELDRIMSQNGDGDTSLTLNSLLPSNDLSVEYVSKSNSIVIVFTTPIEVQLVATINFDLSKLMDIHTSSYNLVKTKMNATEGFTEGLETSDVNNMLSNMECEWIPYDMSGNQDIVKTYLLESTFFGDKITNDGIVMVKYFVFFILYLFFIYTIVPIGYVFFGLRALTVDEMNTTDESSRNTILKRIGGFELFFNFFLVLLSCFLLMMSMIYSKTQYARKYTIAGFMFLIFWLLAYSFIEIQKYTTPLMKQISVLLKDFSPSDMPDFSERFMPAIYYLPQFIQNISTTA
jgi:hypothetical protein